MHPETRQTQKSNRLAVMGLIGSGLFILFCCSCCAFAVVDLEWGAVQTSQDIHDHSLENLNRAGILEEDESLIAYLDMSPIWDGSELVVITDARVIEHRNGSVTDIPLTEVSEVETGLNNIDFGVYKIRDSKGTEIEVVVTENDGLERFGRLLGEALSGAGSNVQVDIPTTN